jgi:hypothetical protein
MGRILKGENGMYNVNGKSFKLLIGSRQQVGHGTAYKTSGQKTRKDIMQNKHGKWVSKSKHMSAKKEKRLEQHGYFAEKGKFGYVKRDKTRRNRKIK